MSESILVLGKDGLLGRALCAQLGARATGFSHADCDLTGVGFLNTVDAAYTTRPFDAIINAAAFTRVDKAENEDSGNLLRVNAVAPGELAAWCQKRGVTFVHFSSDYVFNGSGDRPWKETDTPAPVNTYGMSKLAGERAVTRAGGNHLIFRTSWVYAEYGHNFFNTVRRMMHEKERLTVVDDQRGAPTYAPQLAEAVIEALESAMGLVEFPSGIYHLCHAGETSWCGFARAILERNQAMEKSLACNGVMAITTEQYPTPAQRPLNSRLDCSKIRDELGVSLPHWEEGLEACFAAARLEA